MRPLGVELAAMLADRGVEVIFGIPGVHNIELYRGIEDAGLRHVLARHEQGAGFMADGYARACGKPGVCFVISGPGLTNIMTPMGQAYSDSVPMLVISSCLDETAAKRGQLHQMRDQEGAARTVCDWSETARTTEAAFGLVDRAFGEFATLRHRPKHFQVPISVLRAQSPEPSTAHATVQGYVAPGTAQIARIADTLKAARRPLFVFGGGVSRESAGFSNRVLKRLGAASFVTYAGRGIVDPDDPLFFGSYLSRASSAETVASADCVVAVGTTLSEVDLWRENLGAKVPIIRVDIDAEVLSDANSTGLSVRSDAERFLRALWTELLDHEAKTDWSAESAAIYRARWKAEIDVEHPGIVPICEALRDALPPKTFVFSDMTQFAYVAKEVWDMPAPGLWHHPYGFGTLGYALPAAIGGSVGYDGPVLAIAGDYGFQYTMQELGTAAELGLSLPIMIWDNDALGEIRDCMVEAQIAPNAVTLANPDWGLLAQAYGCGFAEPGSVAELCAAVNAAFSAGRPTIIRAVPGLV